MGQKDSWAGSCLCGEIAFRLRAPGKRLAHCHCQDCRKFHGAAFSTFVEVAKSDIVWEKGAHLLTTFVAENGSRRQFCRQCGSSVTFAGREQHLSIEISRALLEDSSGITPDAQLFCAQKVAWLDGMDDLPCYAGDRP